MHKYIEGELSIYYKILFLIDRKGVDDIFLIPTEDKMCLCTYINLYPNISLIFVHVKTLSSKLFYFPDRRVRQMKKRNRILSTLLAAVIVISALTGCGGKSGEENAPADSADGSAEVGTDESSGQENAGGYVSVRQHLSEDVGSMSPWAADGGGRMAVLPEVYETLFYQRVIGGEALPLLGSSYEKTSDTTVKVTVFDNIYDTAGNHITADDVVFSYNQDIAEGNQPSYVGNIVSVEKVDDYTVQFELASNGVGVLEDSLCSIRIVSQAAYEADKMESNPVGTGPYIMENWVTGSTITLVKNENYWHDEDRAEVAAANADKIIYKVISEPSQILIALETGEVDIVSNAISTTDIHRFLEGGELADKFNVYTEPADLSQVIFFNCSEDNIFSDVRLRQAVCYAIDNQGILDGAYDGLGAVCHCFGGEKSSDYVEAWKSEPYYEYNPEKAKELLAEAGYADGFQIHLLLDAMPSHVLMAQIIQMNLADVGIEVIIDSYDSALFNTYRFDPTQFDIHINNKAGAYVAQQWQYSLDPDFFGGATTNFLVDEKLFDLYKTAINLDTHTPENMDACWQYIKEIVPVYGICFGYNYYVGTQGVEEFYIEPHNSVITGACTFSSDFKGGE